MLLMIVLANTPWYLYGSTAGLATIHPEDGSALDRFVQLLIMTLVDSRVYPMFAFLFGYGMVQMFSRQVAAGIPVKPARRLLRRAELVVARLRLRARRPALVRRRPRRVRAGRAGPGRPSSSNAAAGP